MADYYDLDGGIDGRRQPDVGAFENMLVHLDVVSRDGTKARGPLPGP